VLIVPVFLDAGRRDAAQLPAGSSCELFPFAYYSPLPLRAFNVTAVSSRLAVQADGVREGRRLLLEADGQGHALHLHALRRRLALERDVPSRLVDAQAAPQGTDGPHWSSVVFLSPWPLL
jgi:hypothetical protein